MWTVIEEIERVTAELKIPRSELRRCDNDEAKKIYKKAKETFVKDNPRVWWLGLKVLFEIVKPNKGQTFSEVLRERIPKSEKHFWFIPETEEEEFIVFEAELNAIELLIKECFFFEYNIIGKEFNWIIIENDHNEFVFAESKNKELIQS